MTRAGELFIAAAAGSFIEVDQFHHIPARPGCRERNLAIVICGQSLLPLRRADDGDFAFGQWLTEKHENKGIAIRRGGYQLQVEPWAVSARPALA